MTLGDTARKRSSRTAGALGALLLIVTSAGSRPRAAEKPGPEATPAVAAILTQASKKVEASDGREALRLADQALEAARAAGDAGGEGHAQRERARSCQLLGRFSEEREAWEKAREIWRRIGAMPEEIEASLAEAFLLATVDPAREKELITNAIALARAQMSRPLAAAAALHAASVQYRDTRIEAALRLSSAALDVRETNHPDSLDVASSLSEIGIIFRRQGDIRLARKYHERALEIRRRLAPGSLEESDSLHSLGAVLAESENVKDKVAAREHYLRSLEIRERLAPGSRRVADVLINLGNLAADHDQDLHQTRAYLERAVPILETHAPGTMSLAALYDSLGDDASRLRDASTARLFYRRSIETLERVAPHGFYHALVLKNLGNLEFEEGNLETAEATLSQAWEVLRRLAGSMSGERARKSFGLYTGRFTADLARVLVRRNRFSEALETVEQGRSAALLQSLALPDLESMTTPEVWARYATARQMVQGVRKQLEVLASLEAKADREYQDLRSTVPPSAPQLAVKSEEISSLRAERESVENEFHRLEIQTDLALAAVVQTAPAYLSSQPLPLDEARAALPEGSLFVAFVANRSGLRNRDYTLVLLVPQNPTADVVAYEVPLHYDDLRARVHSIADLARTPKAARPAMLEHERRLVVEGTDLFRTLFPHAARQAIESSRRLVISPDGPLWDLPFAALPLSAGGDGVRWLGLEKPLAYTQSLSVYARQKARGVAWSAGAALVVGDPTYERLSSTDEADQRAGSEGREGRTRLYVEGQPPQRLPGSRDEARRVASLYGVQPLLQEAATEPLVRSRIGDARVIHLAAHGYFDPRRPMSSGILLSKPGAGLIETESDGALQAWEFADSIRLQAELVVLSGCETARGETIRGEGLLGLTRALQIAGARSIVATQWKIADRRSADFLEGFHRALIEGADKDEALMLAMRGARSRSATRAPYFWAGFILMGDLSGLGAGGGP